MKSGVYTTPKKDGTTLYRASITVKDKHISLGSFSNEDLAHKAYLQAKRILSSKKTLDSYTDDFRDGKKSSLPFDKVVMLCNLRDNGVYIKTPIYLEKRSFLYFYSPEVRYRFDADDLFYYSNHKIMKRGSHLFVADYGMQVNILGRYGIRSHAVAGRDYVFANGDETDLRYDNIKIINRYYGVTKVDNNGRDQYVAKIHINGDVIIGKYATENEAAVAYNKAVYLLKEAGVETAYPENYLEDITELQYVALFNKVRLSDNIRKYAES